VREFTDRTLAAEEDVGRKSEFDEGIIGDCMYPMNSRLRQTETMVLQMNILETMH
jgi:hypothetical protein